MKQRRLLLLLVVMTSLLVLRWWYPSATGDNADVAQVIATPIATAMAASAVVANMTSPADASRERATSLEDLAAGTRDVDAAGGPRNAFAVRTPPPVTAPPPPQAIVVAARPPQSDAAPTLPSLPPPPPSPPLQVIGTWRDARGASIFVGSPRSVLQGRVGDVLLSEYRIERITPQQVLLRHLPSGRDVPLAVPVNAAPSLALAN